MLAIIQADAIISIVIIYHIDIMMQQTKCELNAMGWGKYVNNKKQQMLSTGHMMGPMKTKKKFLTFYLTCLSEVLWSAE